MEEEIKNELQRGGACVIAKNSINPVKEREKWTAACEQLNASNKRRSLLCLKQAESLPDSNEYKAAEILYWQRQLKYL